MSNPSHDSRMHGLRKLLAAASADAAKLDAIKGGGDYDAQLVLVDRLTSHCAQGLYLLEPLHDECATQVFSAQRRAVNDPRANPSVADDDLAEPAQVLSHTSCLHEFLTEGQRRIQVMEELTVAPLLAPVAIAAQRQTAVSGFAQAFEEVTRA